MTEALGAEKGERAAGRQGYRSGYYGRTLITRVGKLELRVVKRQAIGTPDRHGKGTPSGRMALNDAGVPEEPVRSMPRSSALGVQSIPLSQLPPCRGLGAACSAYSVISTAGSSLEGIRLSVGNFRCRAFEELGSHKTPRWREMDSNHRYLARRSQFLLRKANAGDRTRSAKRSGLSAGGKRIRTPGPGHVVRSEWLPPPQQPRFGPFSSPPARPAIRANRGPIGVWAARACVAP
jgi:hypothetical protein